MITVHDIYSFDPNTVVEHEEFTDVIERHFRQPEQGLGFDNSPVSHMWRAMIRPAKCLGFRHADTSGLQWRRHDQIAKD